MQDLPPWTVKFFDETHIVAKRHETAMARGPRGQRVTAVVPNPEKYFLSLNGITSLGCWGKPSVLWNYCDGTTSGLDVLEFFQTAIEFGYLAWGDTLVMDNAPIHHQHTDLLYEIMAPAGVRVVFMPKYSPELNPIELVWSKLKAKVRRYGKHTKEAAEQSAMRALDEVTDEDISGSN